MSELILTISEQSDDARTLHAALNRYLDVSEPRFAFQGATSPPSFIQLLGDVAAWLPLSAAATIYLGAIAKRAGEATWDGLASLFKSKEVKPLANVATALVEAADRIAAEVTISVGLSIPDDYFGTSISTKSLDPVEVARVLSTFIVRAEQIAKTMLVEIECGRGPLGPVIVELQEDGSLVLKWLTAADKKTYKKRIL